MPGFSKVASPAGGGRGDGAVGLLGCGPVLLPTSRGGVPPLPALWWLLRSRACCSPAFGGLCDDAAAGGSPDLVVLAGYGSSAPAGGKVHGSGVVVAPPWRRRCADQLQVVPDVAGCVGVWRPVAPGDSLRGFCRHRRRGARGCHFSFLKGCRGALWPCPPPRFVFG